MKTMLALVMLAVPLVAIGGMISMMGEGDTRIQACRDAKRAAADVLLRSRGPVERTAESCECDPVSTNLGGVRWECEATITYEEHKSKSLRETMRELSNE